jgi:arsenite oxidase large subunit
MHLSINSGTDLALFNAWLTYIADKGWTDKAFIAASTKDFDKAVAVNRTSLDEAAQITGLTADQIRQSAEWIAQPKQGGARRRTMFSYEKGLIWGNDNYRTNGALVNVALATGNVGRPGGGCVRMGGHQEGYSRPSDAHVGRPAAYVDKLLIEGKGGVHHIWGCDHYKTTLNALKFKQAYKRRTDTVKDAMSAVPYGDRAGMVNAIMAAIKSGGLFAVDVDIVPTKIGQACHVWLPAAASGEMNLTSMNGERRMRLTERYMDPPGQAMPDCLIAARIANHMERVLRERGKTQVADQFKGFDWKTEEDAFMDGYHTHEKGGEFVTYARLKAMGNNGFQEPAVDFKDGQIIGTKRLFADGKFGSKDSKATFMETKWRGLQAEGKQAEKDKWPFLINNGRTNCLAECLSRPAKRLGHGSLALSLHRDESAGHDGAKRQGRRSRRGLQRQWLNAGDCVSDRLSEAEADFHAVCLSDRRAGKRGFAWRERVHHSELQADLGWNPKDRGCA